MEPAPPSPSACDSSTRVITLFLRLSTNHRPSETLISVVIPAYKPSHQLLILVQELHSPAISLIVIVDDGSGREYDSIFLALATNPNVRILSHDMNLGKGAALKTGIDCALQSLAGCVGIVTADADGQHAAADVHRVARRFAGSPDALVLGTRAFSGPVPLRSRLGNSITHTVMRLVAGQRISDTQTGLRAIPRALAKRMLTVPASGYEFELQMLIAAGHLGVPVIEEPIRTIYQPGNASSHFNPLRDSMRIYFVLLRFGLISMLTSGLDNLAFYFLFRASRVVALSLLGARLLSVAFNYTVVRKAVFFSHAQHHIALPRYLLLAAANVCLSYALISLLTGMFSFRVIPAKISVETLMFIANFVIQRDFVFARRSSGASEPRP
jgi:glycosyltransferase involved in cell wall biosynthesis